MNESFPKYQYSIFLRDTRDEQLVIRTDTFEELLEAKKNIDTIITKRENVTLKQKTIPIEQFEEVCEKCGSKKGTSKKGNKYCLAKCWLKNE